MSRLNAIIDFASSNFTNMEAAIREKMLWTKLEYTNPSDEKYGYN